MPWQTLTLLLAVAIVLLHLWWGRRHAVLRESSEWIRRERDQLERDRDEVRKEVGSQQNALFDSMVEGVLLLDVEGRIKHANQALLQLFELTVDRAVGRTIMESLRLHELEAMLNFLEHKNQIMGTEISPPGKEDSKIGVNAVSIKDAAGTHNGFIMVFHDLTRIRQLENTRREFVANASHELRTPLSMIKGYAETLLDGAKADPEALDRFLLTIAKHADRLTLLTEDLLSLSKMESEPDRLNLSETDLSVLADSVLEEFSAKADKQKLELQNNIPEGLMLQADPDRLQQVLFNLVDNAVKYSGKGSQVTITSQPASHNLVEVCVSDKGKGIPQDALDRIFERFYRVDKSRSRESGDTGLGLAIVKHIVQLHGGTVWCESSHGEGARFFFTLNTGTLAGASA